jgi:hypothetical protein
MRRQLTTLRAALKIPRNSRHQASRLHELPEGATDRAHVRKCAEAHLDSKGLTIRAASHGTYGEPRIAAVLFDRIIMVSS